MSQIGRVKFTDFTDKLDGIERQSLLEFPFVLFNLNKFNLKKKLLTISLIYLKN